jgi:hypothetical protein
MMHLAVALLLFLQVLPLQPVDSGTVKLGRGHISIALPAGWTIDDGAVNMENVVYTLRPRHSRKAALKLYIVGSTQKEDIGQNVTPICVNGVHGTMTVARGMKRILFELPMPPGTGPVDAEALLEFCASDIVAQRVANSFRFQPAPPKCS